MTQVSKWTRLFCSGKNEWAAPGLRIANEQCFWLKWIIHFKKGNTAKKPNTLNRKHSFGVGGFSQNVQAPTVRIDGNICAEKTVAEKERTEQK